jgi:8-amino-7-oxononanoate synthase
MASPSIPLFEALAAEIAALQDQGLRRSRAHLDGPQAARVRIEGRDFVSFASNDYLGLASDPRLIETAKAAADSFGVGAGASHLLYGHSAAHDALERDLARFVGYPGALLFSTGYMANLGVVTALCGRDDEIFADRLNHASLNDAMVLSRARIRRYPHCDVEALERALKGSRARRKLVATDAVFSMDGDIAPLPELLAACERQGAYLLVDDAHGFGVLGPHGAGTLAEFGIVSPRILYMGTLGKAAGVYGAFVAGAEVLIDYLVNRARTYIYTTATPPMMAAVLRESLNIIAAQDARRAQLARLAAELVQALGRHAPKLMPSRTAIQPLVLGDAEHAVAVSRTLKSRGFIVPAVRPPTVPAGTARLRISLSATHTIDDVRALASAVNEVLV